MECSNCGVKPGPDAKFCPNCGQPVRQTEFAGGSIQLGQHIPSGLRDKLEEVRTNRAMQGERRVVTLLFCDVKGSTAMAESLDPEEWAEIMNDAFEHLIKPIYKYEGTVARLLGDGLLAFFGAPIAHEDDAQRAVMAALEMIQGIQPFTERLLRRKGLDFNIRIGLNTGLVVIGEVGSDLRVEYTPMGDAVNVAARMEQTAKPGSVQVSGNTYRLVSDLFDFEPLGGIEVKGKAEPVEAYRAIGKRPGAVPARGIQGLRSPLVGRERELSLLRSRLEEVLLGRGQIVSVVGEAGIGKSRLLAELRQAAPLPDSDTPGNGRAHQDTLQWFEARAFSYETNTPYAPFRALLSNIFALQGAESDAEKVTRIRQGLAEISQDGEQDSTPFLASVSGLNLTGEDLARVKYLEPPQLREAALQAITSLISRLARSTPIVLVMEDLHWADPTSLELVAQLAALTDSSPLMLVALFRPQRQDPSWQFHEKAARDFPHSYTQIVLEPLDEAQSRTLVGNLLHIEDLPEQVRALILKKAEGNPFFVEEVIRSLLDAGLVVRDGEHWRATREIAGIALPDTLAGVITARLDRLDKEARQVAQTAAVIGREFQYDVLSDVRNNEHEARPDAQLAELQRRELIRERLRIPSRLYMFKHVLTQETAYSSLLLSRRRQLHMEVAECLEKREPQATNDIARHFLAANAEMRALPYLAEAGRRAMRAYANQEALAALKPALDIITDNDDPQYARQVYEGIGKTLVITGDMPGAQNNYQDMVRFAEAHADIPMKVSALNQLSMLAMWTGRFPDMQQYLGDAERLAEDADDFAGLAEGYTIRCMSCNIIADFDSALHYLGNAVKIGEKLNSKEQTAFGLAHTAQTLLLMTDFEASHEKAQQSLKIATEIDDRAHIAEVKSFYLPYYQLRQGELDEAQRLAEEGSELAASIGTAMWEGMALYMQGSILYMRGDYSRAIELLERAFKAGEHSGYSFISLYPLCVLGSLYLDISPQLADRTKQYHEEVSQRLNDPVAGWALATVRAELGFSALQLGEVEKAADFFEKGLTLPAPEIYLNKPRFLCGSALVALKRGQQQEAERLAQEAQQFTEERQMRHLYPLVYLVSGNVALASGDAQAALDVLSEGEARAVRMQARPAIWQTQAAIAQALDALGKREEANKKREQARAVTEEIASKINDEHFRELYLQNAQRQLM